MSRALSIILFFVASQTWAWQNPIDSMEIERKLFHTNIYLGHTKLTKAEFSQHLIKSPKWSAKNKLANGLMIAGPIVSFAGTYMAVDAIKGIKKTAVIENKNYPYVKRNLPELLVGIAFFMTGFCLLESANETKSNAAKWYNKMRKNEFGKDKVGFNIQIGITESASIGIMAKFKIR